MVSNSGAMKGANSSAAHDLMKWPSGSTSTMLEMSSGRRPQESNKDWPAVLCSAAIRKRPSVSWSNMKSTAPLHKLQTPAGKGN